jgi:hypothetical protein
MVPRDIARLDPTRGRCRVFISRDGELILGPDQSAIGPPNVPHEWRNPSDDEEVRFLVGVRPGPTVETMLETLLTLRATERPWGPSQEPIQWQFREEHYGAKEERRDTHLRRGGHGVRVGARPVKPS